NFRIFLFVVPTVAVKRFTLSSQRRRIIGIPFFCTSLFSIFSFDRWFFALFAAIAYDLLKK
ncbi:hypothetical protein, partial [Atlantibacter hermannii]|uniref:hypothetical protein n=1 Tax=Atlantibacter hermannii TaxID=565 RepID=UPI001EE3DFA4